jgi:lactate dehydrogenase-like 2-hydroxyacid dehydrogenase
VAVAEQAIALMLGLYRMVVDGHKGTIDGSPGLTGLVGRRIDAADDFYPGIRSLRTSSMIP